MQLASFVLAFCGLMYELVLAQTMSVLLGNSFLQYGLTIGLFMAGMGLGAFRAQSPADPRARLIYLQSVLCAAAPLGFLLLWAAALVLPALALWPMACALIFAIGFLTGQELPLLMAGAKDANAVLAADYFGMLAASLLFPYLFLPSLGMLGSLCAAALLNSLSIQFFFRGRSLRRRLAFAALPAALGLLLLCEGPVWQWFSRQYVSSLL